jgi:hypothetical protein
MPHSGCLSARAARCFLLILEGCQACSGQRSAKVRGLCVVARHWRGDAALGDKVIKC